MRNATTERTLMAQDSLGAAYRAYMAGLTREERLAWVTEMGQAWAATGPVAPQTPSPSRETAPNARVPAAPDEGPHSGLSDARSTPRATIAMPRTVVPTRMLPSDGVPPMSPMEAELARLCTRPLKPIDRSVLLLVDLDPMLATKLHRPRLCLLLALFPPRRSHQRIGHAVAHLRDLAAAGMVHADAFHPRFQPRQPSREACERVFAWLIAASEASEAPGSILAERKTAFLRLFGHL